MGPSIAVPPAGHPPPAPGHSPCYAQHPLLSALFCPLWLFQNPGSPSAPPPCSCHPVATRGLPTPPHCFLPPWTPTSQPPTRLCWSFPSLQTAGQMSKSPRTSKPSPKPAFLSGCNPPPPLKMFLCRILTAERNSPGFSGSKRNACSARSLHLTALFSSLAHTSLWERGRVPAARRHLCFLFL